MKRTIPALFGFAAALLLAGCGDPNATKPSPEKAPPPAPGPTDDRTPTTPTPGPDNTPPKPDTTLPKPPITVVVFRVERDEVTIKPGGEAKVNLLSVPKGEKVTVSVDPADAKITAVVADKDVLTIKAGKDASGEATVTVKAGKESAKVKVDVEG